MTINEACQGYIRKVKDGRTASVPTDGQTERQKRQNISDFLSVYLAVSFAVAIFQSVAAVSGFHARESESWTKSTRQKNLSSSSSSSSHFHDCVVLQKKMLLCPLMRVGLDRTLPGGYFFFWWKRIGPRLFFCVYPFEDYHKGGGGGGK